MADDKVKVTIYVTPEFKARLDSIADSERRTGNQQNVLLLEQAVEQWERGKMDGVEFVLPVRSQPMIDGDTVRPFEPAPVVKAKRPRTTVCPHRLAPDQFCRVCDA